MRARLRFLLGVALGGGGLLAYTAYVGVDQILGRLGGLEPWVVGVLVGLVVAEGLADGIGVWASVAPLGDGFDARQSVQFALAGDFFDVLSPAGSVSSEPIMAQFIGVATETSYSEALGVRGVAKYAKAAGQLLVSAAVGLAVLSGNPDASAVLATLGLGVGALVGIGFAVAAGQSLLTRVALVGLTPVLAWVSQFYRAEPHDRASVGAALDRFWHRVAQFRSRPALLGLIVLGGVVEQVLTAVTLWYLLAAVGSPVSLLPILVVVPLPQAATVVPIPASLGTYDLLLGGALVLAAGAPAAAAATAVLVFRTATILFSVGAGGLSVAFLRGWRPSGL
ncbi:lysylphosphatidylglycerol synthase domain-containing protein [Halobacteriales archaeon Cl-PHB]